MSGQVPGYVPAWAAAPGVGAFVTESGGAPASLPYGHFNLAQHVGDDPAAVAANRARLRAALGLAREPAWLQQVHGTRVVDAATVDPGAPPPEADASWTRARGVACVVLTADCLPVLLAARDGSVVGAAHAGWRGLCNGVIEALVAAMDVRGESLQAFLGPCIGPAAFEVGAEVREAFLARDGRAAEGFRAVTRQDGTPGFLADLHALARLRLAALGVRDVTGGEACTVREADRFYSFRRQPRTGRFASLAWRR